MIQFTDRLSQLRRRSADKLAAFEKIEPKTKTVNRKCKSRNRKCSLSSTCPKMFGANTKALIKNLGAEGDLIYNKNINTKVPILTLVKEKDWVLWPWIKYTLVDQSLLDLLEEAEFTPEYKEDVLAKNITMSQFISGSGEVGLKTPKGAANLQVTGGVDTVDAVSTFTLNRRTVNIDKLRKSCNGRKLKQEEVDGLRLKKSEKLKFVYQTVFNVAPVTFDKGEGSKGSMTAGCSLFTKLQMMVSRKQKMKFDIDANFTFAYSLMEITTDGGTLGIPRRTTKVDMCKPGCWPISSDSAGDYLQTAVQEIKKKERFLQPLSGLKESTRRDLMNKLRQIKDDENALTQLEDTLDQNSSGSDLPQSDLSSGQRRAVLLLVSAINTLPLGAAPLLIGSDPIALNDLRQLVRDLIDGQVTHPEAPPPSLKEEGELSWAAELLCSTNQTLSQLSMPSKQWVGPDTPPEVLLEVLSLTVIGLDLMMSSRN
ncbi:uncharacterized protein LOC115415803 [Sphaeramia orbicularis]|uniref:uncharacterized protein LOC115415803 n=1 Tax=Sphaeramia orbicularis TaxID=375764 RepID=UPI00117FBCF0|nr:uncharacterized protein LOC115415803 [Sphaeramia orbicularis]